MVRGCRALIGVSVCALWGFTAGVSSGEAPPSSDKSKAGIQAEQRKPSKEPDVQSRGLLTQKKKSKKKPAGGAAAHSQPADRSDPPAGDPAGRVMP